MAHARQTIREAAATKVTGLTSTSTRVFQSRMVPQETLPCLLVATNDEEINPGTIGKPNHGAPPSFAWLESGDDGPPRWKIVAVP